MKDLADDPTPQLPSATRTEYRRIDHYVQVGNHPDGTPILEPVYADLFDNEGNNSTQADPPIGNENNLIFALGGNDTVTTGTGDDQIHGGDGQDTLSAGGGHDFLYGDTGNDTLTGSLGNDWLYGGGGQ